MLEPSIFSETTQTRLAEHNESWNFVAGRNEVDLRPGFPFLAKMITSSTGRADQPQINESREPMEADSHDPSSLLRSEPFVARGSRHFHENVR